MFLFGMFALTSCLQIDIGICLFHHYNKWQCFFQSEREGEREREREREREGERERERERQREREREKASVRMATYSPTFFVICIRVPTIFSSPVQRQCHCFFLLNRTNMQTNK